MSPCPSSEPPHPSWPWSTGQASPMLPSVARAGTSPLVFRHSVWGREKEFLEPQTSSHFVHQSSSPTVVPVGSCIFLATQVSPWLCQPLAVPSFHARDTPVHLKAPAKSTSGICPWMSLLQSSCPQPPHHPRARALLIQGWHLRLLGEPAELDETAMATSSPSWHHHHVPTAGSSLWMFPLHGSA